MKIVDVRVRGPKKRRSIVVSVDGVIIKQFAVRPGQSEEDTLREIHDIAVARGSELFATNTDEIVLTADHLNWEGLEEG